MKRDDLLKANAYNLSHAGCYSNSFSALLSQLELSQQTLKCCEQFPKMETRLRHIGKEEHPREEKFNIAIK
jgi:hypothetical protein